jgi:hypothetical protein
MEDAVVGPRVEQHPLAAIFDDAGRAAEIDELHDPCPISQGATE